MCGISGIVDFERHARSVGLRLGLAHLLPPKGCPGQPFQAGRDGGHAAWSCFSSAAKGAITSIVLVWVRSANSLAWAVEVSTRCCTQAACSSATSRRLRASIVARGLVRAGLPSG